MSKYTTEVRFICENYAGLGKSTGGDNVKDVIDKSWQKIFDFDFPIFDEDYREVLCKKIIKHYYTREIGLETVGLWKLKLDTKLNEIMPFYNQLYKSELLKFDPFMDTDYKREHSGSANSVGKDVENNTTNTKNLHTGDTTDNGTHGGSVVDDGSHGGTVTDDGSITSTGSDYDLYSDTPQGALTGVNNETYLTNARKVTNTKNDKTDNVRTFDETTGNERTYDETTTNKRIYNEEVNVDTKNNSVFDKTLDTVDSYLDHIFGKTGGKNYSELLKEFRSTFLNIDMQVVNELRELFMLVW